MAKRKLNLSAEERRLYDNEMHRKQEKARREKKKREGYREWVKTIVEIVERLGWDRTDLIVGADSDIIDAVVDELMEDDRFKITLGKQIGLKPITRTELPSVFVKHYHSFTDGIMNISELARICNLSRPTIYKYIKLM